jgi:hypothetical protein
MSYGITPYNGSCQNANSGFGPSDVTCTPPGPSNFGKFASTGVIACGKNSVATIIIGISEVV